MKILQVTPGYHPDLGGVENHVQAISNALVDCGHEVSVVTMLHKKELPKVERIGKIIVRRFPAVGPQAYRIPIGLFRYLYREGSGFDVIHAHNYGALPLLLAVLAGWQRTVITPHYHGQGRSRLADILHQVYDPVAIPVLKRAGGVVCVSTGEAELVAQRLGIAKDNIVVIPNAIMHYAQSACDKSNMANKDNPILSVGRLDAYKRVDRVIASLPHLSKDFTLVVIGVGPERVALERLASSFGVEDRVRFLGYVSDDELRNWYVRSKVVVSFSEGEAFGRIVVEALASGCQIVCNDIPAFRDFSVKFPGEVSIISSKAKEQEVAEAIRSAAVKPFHPVDLQEYTGTKIADQLLKVYSVVMNKNE